MPTKLICRYGATMLYGSQNVGGFEMLCVSDEGKYKFFNKRKS